MVKPIINYTQSCVTTYSNHAPGSQKSMEVADLTFRVIGTGRTFRAIYNRRFGLVCCCHLPAVKENWLKPTY